MKTETQLTTITEAKEVSFIPFGQAEPLRLTLADVQTTIANPTRSGKRPSERDCLLFMALCKARGLNPYVNDAYLVGYDGQGGPQFSLITSIQALQKRAEANENFDGIESGVIIEGKDGLTVDLPGAFLPKGAKLLGAWAKVYRRDRKVPHEARINFETFNSGKSRWSSDPAGMIVKCAKAAAYREAFPTELGGLYTGDEQAVRERQVEGRVVESGERVKGKTVAALPKPQAKPQFIKDEAKDAEPEAEPVEAERLATEDEIGDLDANLFDAGIESMEKFLRYVASVKKANWTRWEEVPASIVLAIGEDGKSLTKAVEGFRKWEAKQ